MKNSRWVRDVVRLSKINEVYLKVHSEPSVVQELSDHLTFMVPGAKFMPAYKNKFWDGKIRLLNSLTGLTYTGLVKEISEFCETRNYVVEVDRDLLPYPPDDIPVVETTKEPRTYQLDAYKAAVNLERAIFLSPTASGKSLIIYLISTFFAERKLIIVPTVSLVLQMKKDFEDYAGRSLKIHCITAGVDKESTENVVITTWQSVYKMPKTWFNQFGVVIGDEVHQFKATSLKSIMEKLENCKYRFGFTGTLDGSQTNKITLEGLFGPVRQVTTTTDLQEQGHVAQLDIKVVVLKHPKEEAKLVSKMNYQDEVDFLVRSDKRNKFISNLGLSLNGNSLILFQYVDKHGKVLNDLFRQKDPDRKIFFIHGGIDGEDREQVRHIVENESNAIIIASYGTFSTGINIRNLHNIVLASPSKSRIRVLQSIGRGLRKGEDKDRMVLYDIADDFRHGSKINFTLNHLNERLSIYNEQSFNYKIYNTDL